jgi:hypothetical protein
MGRAFHFSTWIRNEAFIRRGKRCACCGENLEDLWDNAHHVLPDQAGIPGATEDRFIASVENCVVLCSDCHYAVHDSGRYRNGPVAPPSYFRYSHGSDTGAHHAWAGRLDEMIERKYRR